jgi:AcrR family transcriptional regulator
VVVNTRKHRSEPLPPDDRRRAIVDAVIPLLLTEGSAVTSRQIAEAAGIAEGTIFRVFSDKPSVILEAIKVSMDPEPVRDALAQIPESDSMETQLQEATRVLLDRTDRVATLIGILHTVKTPGTDRPAGTRHFVTESNTVILAALTDLLERHRGRLRVAPAEAAVAFRGFVFANAHPMVAADDRATPEEIVAVLLNGIASPGGEASV